jgi:hypothetical protein
MNYKKYSDLTYNEIALHQFKTFRYNNLSISKVEGLNAANHGLLSCTAYNVQLKHLDSHSQVDFMNGAITSLRP